MMYTTEPDKNEWPNANFEGLRIAFFKGNDQDDWENIDHNGWSHYENDNFTFDVEILHEYDDKGNTMHDLYVAFGEINNPEIFSIETRSEGQTEFEKAKVTMNQGKRYYFQIGR